MRTGLKGAWKWVVGDRIGAVIDQQNRHVGLGLEKSIQQWHCLRAGTVLQGKLNDRRLIPPYCGRQYFVFRCLACLVSQKEFDKAMKAGLDGDPQRRLLVIRGHRDAVTVSYPALKLKEAALATEPQDMIGFRIWNRLWSFRSHTPWARGQRRRMRHGIKALRAIELCVLLVADSLRPVFPRMPGHRGRSYYNGLRRRAARCQTAGSWAFIKPLQRAGGDPPGNSFAQFSDLLTMTVTEPSHASARTRPSRYSMSDGWSRRRISSGTSVQMSPVPALEPVIGVPEDATADFADRRQSVLSP